MKIQYLNMLKDNGYCIVPVSAEQPINCELMEKRCMMIALCAKGSIDCEFNMERVHLEEGMRICYAHVVQLRTISQSEDLQLRLLVLTDDFSFNSSTGIAINVVQTLFENPFDVVENATFFQILNSMFDVLEQYSLLPANQQNKQVSMGTVRNVILILGQLAMEKSSSLSSRQLYTMADTYFRNFINDVSDNVKREHEVMFYARKLNITPKYISEICKQKTGRKAKEIISAILLRLLKADLLLSGKSMKELAAEYGFADQSSLGKFFRKMTGLSPLHYRQHEITVKKVYTE